MIRSIVRPIVRPIGRLIVGGVAGFNPIELFNGGVVGGWYDPSDLTTLWQDSGRTTPVTAYGQPVGAIDDKSGNGRHLIQATAINRPTYAGSTIADTGADLVSNGTFASDTVWAKGAGWTISGGVGVATASSAGISQTVALVAGRLYRLTYTVAGYSAGTLTPRFTGGATVSAPAVSANGTYTVYIRAETSNVTLSFLGAGLTCTIDNVALLEQTHSGYPSLLFNGVAHALAESGTHTLRLPAYVAAALAKDAQDALGFFGSILDANNLAALVNVATNSRYSGSCNSTARGNVNVPSNNNDVPVSTRAIVDTLSTVGATVTRVNAAAQTSAANTWVAADTVAASKLRLAGTGGGLAAPGRFLGGVVLVASNPGTLLRDALRRWLGRKVGVTF
jgi:hypothetical protein